MDFFFNGYSLVLLFFGTLTIALAIYVYNRAGAAVRWFSYMMISNALWSLAYGFELASPNLKQIIFFINIEYLGIATLPLFWFLFCLNFCGKDCWYKKPKNLISILIFPIITILMVWTNPYHHWHYKELLLNSANGFPLVEIHQGLWYHVFTAYFYMLLASGCYLLVMKFKSSDRIYKRQNYSVLVAALIPWVANILYLMGIRPFGLIDITPFAFIATTFLILIGIYRFKLFDIIPIAREKALELMQDGFLVLDNHLRIIDFNSAILKYISVEPNKSLIGKPIQDFFKEHVAITERIISKIPGKVEIPVNVDGHELFLEADVRFLNENNINGDYTIIKLQDFTSSKQEALQIKKQAEELEKLNNLKDRIFSIIAHDLRGPLVNLSEVLKLISSKQISMDEFDDLAPELSKDIVYTTDLLENILHWSRSQLKGFGIKKEFFAIRNVITNEINYHQHAASLKNIKIIHDVFPTEVVYADILMFEIVIRNILNNAIKFCNQNSEIHIVANYQKEGMLNICVRDTGVGIPKNILDKLFKDENISTRGTNNEKGTGLGLLVCKDFMQKNGGDITVTSKVGVGSIFCITLPTKD